MAAPCASVGPPFQGFKFCWDLFPGRCPGLAWAAPLWRKIAVSVKLGLGVGSWRWILAVGFGVGFWRWVLALGLGVGSWRWVLALGLGVGFWRWVLALGLGGPERARHDIPGQRPGLNAPMISSPEGAAPLARENGPMTETGDTHVSLSMPRTKSRCPPTPAPHTPQLEKGMCTVRISAEALALRRNLITTMGVPQCRHSRGQRPGFNGEDLGHPSNFQPRQEAAALGPFASVIYSLSPHRAPQNALPHQQSLSCGRGDAAVIIPPTWPVLGDWRQLNVCRKTL